MAHAMIFGSRSPSPNTGGPGYRVGYRYIRNLLHLTFAPKVEQPRVRRRTGYRKVDYLSTHVWDAISNCT